MNPITWTRTGPDQESLLLCHWRPSSRQVGAQSMGIISYLCRESTPLRLLPQSVISQSCVNVIACHPRGRSMGRRRSRLGIDDYAGGLREEVTTFAGAGLLIELYRQAGIRGTAERVLPQKRSKRGLTAGQMEECFVLLSALGGECVEDMEHLRDDAGLEVILGYRLPGPGRRPTPRCPPKLAVPAPTPVRTWFSLNNKLYPLEGQAEGSGLGGAVVDEASPEPRSKVAL